MKRLDRISKELELISNKIEKINLNSIKFKESDISDLKEKFVEYMQTHNTVNTKRLLDSTIHKVNVNEDNVQIVFANGISIDKKTKSKIKKGNIMKNTKTINLDALLLGADYQTENDMVNLNLAIRPRNKYNFSGSCKIQMSYDDFVNLAEESVCGFEDLIGSKIYLGAEMNGDKIIDIVSIDKAS